MISTQDYSKDKLKLDSTSWMLNVFKIDRENLESWIIEQDKIKKIRYKYFNESPGWSLIGIKVWLEKSTLKVYSYYFTINPFKLCMKFQLIF